MPMFDVQCANGHEAEQFAWDVARLRVCDTCGADVTRIVKPSRAAVIGDDIPGGETVENFAPTPLTFYSRSEKSRYMRAHGIRPRVQHVGVQGSDRSPHTSRWT